MEKYDVHGRIGEGAHGIVLKAKHLQVSRIKLSGDHTITGEHNHTSTNRCRRTKCTKPTSAVILFQSGDTVALKKVPLKRLEEGIPNQALREIKALQELNHENVSFSRTGNL